MADPTKSEGPRDFDARLQAARNASGLDRPASTGAPTGPWGIGVRAGVEVASALAVGVGLGLALDWWLGTGPLLLVVLFVAGSVAGVLNVYRLMMGRGTKPPT